MLPYRRRIVPRRWAVWRHSLFLLANLLFSFIAAIEIDDAINQATPLLKEGRTQEVRLLLEEALKEEATPDSPSPSRHHAPVAAHLLLGTVHHLEGDWDEAMAHYDMALMMDPHRADIYVNKGKALADLGRHEEAIALYRKAVLLQGGGDGHLSRLNLAASLHAVGQSEEAVVLYKQLIDAGYGEDAGLHFSFGLSLQHLGRIMESAYHYQAALHQNPSYIEAALNLAAMHHRYGVVHDSLSHYQTALDLALSSRAEEDVLTNDLIIMIRNNLGVALRQVGEINGAVEQHEIVLSDLRKAKQHLVMHHPSGSDLSLDMLQRETMQTMSHIYRARQSVCHWLGREAMLDDLLRDMEVRLFHNRSIDSLLPFDTLGIHMSHSLRKKIAESYSFHQFQHYLSRFPLPSPPPPSPSLHLGYLCYDFNDHPTAHLVEGLFVHHQMKVSALSYGKNDESAYRRRIEELVAPDGFVELAAAGHEEAVSMLRQQGPHIVLDLQGHTYGCRTEILALRVAPIQVSYLIYPGTSGASFIDYLIADQYVAPLEKAWEMFTERLVYLPASYQVNYYDRHLEGGLGKQPRTLLRQMNGLPSSGIVFANFNKYDKLEPGIFQLWMGVLRRIPDSVLWLLKPSTPSSTSSSSSALLTMNSLKKEAQAHGVHSNRLIFADRMTKEKHLKRQQAADLFLDSFLYGAHSTATDALRAGLPVLTVPGNAFPQRVGLSLLANLQDYQLYDCLVATSMKDFEEVAVKLVREATASSSESKTIAQHLGDRLRHPENGSTTQQAILFDTKQFTHEMEVAMECLWEVRGFADDDETAGPPDYHYHVVVT